MDASGNSEGCFTPTGTYVLPITDSTSTTSSTTAASATAVKSVQDSKADIAQESWIAPTLLNSWVDFGGGYETAGYMIDTLGFVHLKGIVKSGTSVTAIFNLPLGYRPSERPILSTYSNDAFAAIDITTGGDVRLVTGSNASLSLSGISFRP